MKIFIGMDKRQPIAYSVLQYSIVTRASGPVSITPLIIDQLPIEKRGLTDFTYARYLVPYLCNYEGDAVFLDADMLCLTDITKIRDYDDGSGVQVVKGKHKFEWPSVMYFKCDKCKTLTPEYIETHEPQALDWTSVGELAKTWNVLVGYDKYVQNPKIVHYTMGIPDFKECRSLDYSKEWFNEKEKMLGNVSWIELMGNSVHAPKVLNHLKREAEVA